MKNADNPSPVLQVGRPDLRLDPGASRAVKDERVLVEFAHSAGELSSAVGVNRYAAGDALITGSTGDRWCVSRNRPAPVLARRMGQPFTVARCAGGDSLSGNAGDWLIQYAPGDYGIVERARFEAVYRLMTDGQN
jgi:hypothetical protein